MKIIDCPKCGAVILSETEQLLQKENEQLVAENMRLKKALVDMDKLTYSFDSRKKMEQIRCEAGVVTPSKIK